MARAAFKKRIERLEAKLAPAEPVRDFWGEIDAAVEAANQAMTEFVARCERGENPSPEELPEGLREYGRQICQAYRATPSDAKDTTAAETCDPQPPGQAEGNRDACSDLQAPLAAFPEPDGGPPR
jgi:hypothetical protein